MKDFQVHIDEFLPLRDIVFQTLRRAILMGDLEPGERLMELQLTEKLGVSRTPIREAIRKLELEGLVTMVPRRGAEVAQISAKNLKDVLEVRVALDSLAVRLACERITPEGIEELKRACKDFENATKEKEVDATKVAQADVAFHDVISRVTGNERLLQMIFNLSEQMYRYRFEYIKERSYHDRLVKEHENLCRYIEARDEEKAVEEVTKHICNQLETILKDLESKEK